MAVVDERELLADYERWLERVTATVDAVSYTCRVRLGGDRAAGDAVALRVATGLMARPTVFRHWGLPYSGRIAKLAEDAIVDARAGRLAHRSSWSSFRRDLDALPGEHRTTVVLTCVEGYSDEQLATVWRCDVATARERRTGTLALLRALAARHADHDTAPTERR